MGETKAKGKMQVYKGPVEVWISGIKCGELQEVTWSVDPAKGEDSLGVTAVSRRSSGTFEVEVKDSVPATDFAGLFGASPDMDDEREAEDDEEAQYLARAMFNARMRREAAKIAEHTEETYSLPRPKDGDPYSFGRGAGTVLDRMWERAHEWKHLGEYLALKCAGCMQVRPEPEWGVEGMLLQDHVLGETLDAHVCGRLDKIPAHPRLHAIMLECEAAAAELQRECAYLTEEGYPASLDWYGGDEEEGEDEDEKPATPSKDFSFAIYYTAKTVDGLPVPCAVDVHEVETSAGDKLDRVARSVFGLERQSGARIVPDESDEELRERCKQVLARHHSLAGWWDNAELVPLPNGEDLKIDFKPPSTLREAVREGIQQYNMEEAIARHPGDARVVLHGRLASDPVGVCREIGWARYDREHGAKWQPACPVVVHRAELLTPSGTYPMACDALPLTMMANDTLTFPNVGPTMGLREEKPTLAGIPFPALPSLPSLPLPPLGGGIASEKVRF